MLSCILVTSKDHKQVTIEAYINWFFFFFECPAKTQTSLDIRTVWSEPSPSTWRHLVSLAVYAKLFADM